MYNVVRSGSKAFGFCSSMVMGSLTEILALFVLTLSTVESAYRHVSGIYCCYLQGGSEWCVLWFCVRPLLGSETYVICKP
jgi:hypothetical protein